MKVILCPYEWRADVPGSPVFVHGLPAGVRASLDPRPLSECATRSQGTRNAIMALDDAAALPSGAVQIATDLDETLTAANRLRVRNAFDSTGPVSSTRLGAILHELWTQQADVTQARCAGPLLPTRAMQFELWLGGQMQRREFAGDGPEWPLVQARIRADYRAIRQRVLDGTAPLALHRKWLGDQLRKFRRQDRDFRLFVPDDLPDEGGPMVPSTTLVDDFTRADGGTIGNQLAPWTEYRAGSVLDCFDTVSNQASSTNNTTNNSARGTGNFSGVDHYVQITVTIMNGVGSANNQLGPCTRYDASAQSHYQSRAIGLLNELRIGKTVTGTSTDLQTTGVSYSIPEPIKLTSNGTSQTDELNGTGVNSITDSSITTGTCVGIWGFGVSNNAALDDLTGSDLTAGSGGYLLVKN